jgi:hypothetical protein
MATPRILTYCHIIDNRILLNGNLLFENEKNSTFKSFLKNLYSALQLKYPKFYKMDEISKLGFLASEFLMKNINTNGFDSSEIGVVLSNSQSTLVTDVVHQDTINDLNHYYPSPSVFVYTLPNIMIGEISIRHKFRGENAFFIFERFNGDFIADYINQLFANQKIKACLGGWIDQSANSYKAFVYWVELSDNMDKKPEHNGNILTRLYEKI